MTSPAGASTRGTVAYVAYITDNNVYDKGDSAGPERRCTGNPHRSTASSSQGQGSTI